MIGIRNWVFLTFVVSLLASFFYACGGGGGGSGTNGSVDEDSQTGASILFKHTSESYPMDSDMNAICKQTFGENYNIADWLDIVDAYESGIAADYILLEGNAYITNEGIDFWSDNRHYLVTRHNHNMPDTYLSHDDIDDHLFDLGSWYTELPILCISETEEIIPPNDDDSPTGEENLVVSNFNWVVNGRYSTCAATEAAIGTLQFQSTSNSITGYTYTGEDWHHDCTTDYIGTVNSNISHLNLIDPLTASEVEDFCDTIIPGMVVTVTEYGASRFACSFYDTFDGSTEIVTFTK